MCHWNFHWQLKSNLRPLLERCVNHTIYHSLAPIPGTQTSASLMAAAGLSLSPLRNRHVKRDLTLLGLNSSFVLHRHRGYGLLPSVCDIVALRIVGSKHTSLTFNLNDLSVPQLKRS